MGRPREFCNQDCRRASAAVAGKQTLTVLQRVAPQNYRVVARFLVAADLISRGYVMIGFNWTTAIQDMVVRAAGGGGLQEVSVYSVDVDGTLHDRSADLADIKATVYRDGRIEYVGLKDEGGAGREADAAPE